MPKAYPSKVIQPLGSHNKPHPCVLTSEVKQYLHLPFEYLNPVQSDFLPYLEDDDMNVVVASATSSGKTVIAELFAARAISLGKRVLYICPMKALADEKYYEWSNGVHTFNKYNVQILTGDIEVTEKIKKNLINAHIIILTPEMFNSKCRFYENHKWLSNSVLVCDETHLVGLENRGDSEEVGIIQYFENSPESRALFLSATLPNVEDFGSWLDHMTNRKSLVLKSDYRPCKLNKVFEGFLRAGKYDKTEENRMAKAIEVIKRHYKDDSVLVFVGSKAFGYKLSKNLDRLGIDNRFHCADISRGDKKVKRGSVMEVVEGRTSIEEGFKNSDFNVLIATSTIAWGCNTPARYVIQAHTKFGFTEMHPSNIIQSIGRAGRTGWSDKGDAIILCPTTEITKENNRIFKEYKIKSTLTQVNVLMFHILSYIHSGDISDSKDLFEWHRKTLASVQGSQLSPEMCATVLDNLKGRGMVLFKDGKYKITKLGEVTARMYMSPLDVSDWFRNFSQIDRIKSRPGASMSDETRDNIKIAQALSRCYSWGLTWKNEGNGERSLIPISSTYITERERNSEEVVELCSILNIAPTSPNIKYTALFYRLLSGRPVGPILNSYNMTISKDIERIISTLHQCDMLVGRYFHKKNPAQVPGFGWGDDWNNLQGRLKYGVSSDLAELVGIPGVGKKKAEKLRDKGVKTLAGVLDPANKDACERAVGKKTHEKIVIALSSR